MVHIPSSRLSSYSTITNHSTADAALPRFNRSTSSVSATNNTSVDDPSQFPVESQESIIINDLLFILMGIEGKYIIFLEGPFPVTELDADFRLSSTDLTLTKWYRIHSGLDPSIIDFVKRILPLATCFAIMEAFCYTYSKFTAGFVNHAICGALRSMIKEYILLLVQLETEFRTNPDFSLQKMWYHLVPSATSMHSATEICLAIHDQSRHYTSTNSTRFPSMDNIAYRSMQRLEQASIPISIDPPAQVLSKLHPRGGGILAMLSQRYIAASGDPVACKLHQYLLSHAAVPFLVRLRKWIHFGKLDDPYDEFMIIEDKMPKSTLADDFNDKYWDHRYQLRISAVPSFLDPFATMILHTGKYLNVYIECGASVQLVQEEMAEHTPSASIPLNESTSKDSVVKGVVLHELASAVDGTGQYISEIQTAYWVANGHLLALLNNQHALMPRLRSLKHYMLLDQSDFLDHFLDAAVPELIKPWTQVRLDKVQSLLDIAIRDPGSVTCLDPYKEYVILRMSHTPLFDQMLGILGVTSSESSLSATTSNKPKIYSGMHAMILDHKIEFPLSLVFGKRAITKYQILFRNLVQLKYLERQLGSSWVHQSLIPISKRVTSDLPSLATPTSIAVLAKFGTRVSLLRMRMLAWVQALTGYMTMDVIEPRHLVMEQEITSAQTVDSVLSALNAFFDDCFRDGFLTNHKMLRIYVKLVDAVTRFIHQSDTYTSIAQVPMTNAHHTGTTDRLIQMDKVLDKLEKSWQYHVRLLIDSLKLYSATQSPLFLVLMNRLDYNGYYQDSVAGALAGDYSLEY